MEEKQRHPLSLSQLDALPFADDDGFYPIKPNSGRDEDMQVSGGSPSFNAVNQMRILGHWMRMFTIPNQSPVAKAWQEFDEDGQQAYLADRYSERKESAAELSARMNQRDI